MKLYLIRHGESLGNLQGKIQGTMDFPLSDLGKQQVDLISSYCQNINLDFLYSSDLERAYATAKTIGDSTGLDVQAWEQIREVHLDHFKDFQEMKLENSILKP